MALQSRCHLLFSWPSKGKALNNVGNAHRELRRFDEAIGCFERALVICRETSDRHGEGRVLGNLGLAYQDLGWASRRNG